MSSLNRRLGWTLVGSSLLLHIFTVYCFMQLPDSMAAYTVMPIWLWGGIGLFLASAAFCFLRAPLSLVMTAVWSITLLVGADEARVLANFGKSPPRMGRPELFEGKPVIRVLTLNCALFTYGSPARDIALWQPDIVLLQDVYPDHVRQIADELYAGQGDYRANQTNGIVTRWKILREIRNPLQRDEELTIQLPSSREIEVVNVHLHTAATDLRLWLKQTWIEHRQNRLIRRKELDTTLKILEQTTNFPNTATIFGGDFNSSASDAIHRKLSRDFIDAFASSGTGWGDTFHRRFPILRIDHIYTTRHFTAVRSIVATSRHSDHRMVIADVLLK